MAKRRHYHIVMIQRPLTLGTTTRVTTGPEVFTNRKEAEKWCRWCNHYEPNSWVHYEVSWHWPEEQHGIHY